MVIPYLFRLGGAVVLGRGFFSGRHPHSCDNKLNKQLFFYLFIIIPVSMRPEYVPSFRAEK